MTTITTEELAAMEAAVDRLTGSDTFHYSDSKLLREKFPKLLAAYREVVGERDTLACANAMIVNVSEAIEAEDDLLKSEQQHRIDELKKQQLVIARQYDPNCDEWHFSEQCEAMDAARQIVDAMQELATYLGRDPEGCLVDSVDDVLGRMEAAQSRIAELERELAEAKEDAGRMHYLGNLVRSRTHDEQSERNKLAAKYPPLTTPPTKGKL